VVHGPRPARGCARVSGGSAGGVIMLKEPTHERVMSVMSHRRHIVSGRRNVAILVLKSKRVIFAIKLIARVHSPALGRPRILRFTNAASRLAPVIEEPPDAQHEGMPMRAPAIAVGGHCLRERGGHAQ
jgi:hypothetical protein